LSGDITIISLDTVMKQESDHQTGFKKQRVCKICTLCHSEPTLILLITAISIKVVHGKVEYERERLLGIANKLMNFQSGSQQPFALVFDFSALLVDNLD
jgi:hypothetical protein